mgnify:CR=1 FL=1
MSYSLPSLVSLHSFRSSNRIRRVDTTAPYTVTREQCQKILKHSGAKRTANAELYEALQHFNNLTLAEQEALDEMAFHNYWVIYLSKGIVTIEPMYEVHHGLAHSSVYKCLDRSATVILQTCTSL